MIGISACKKIGTNGASGPTYDAIPSQTPSAMMRKENERREQAVHAIAEHMSEKHGTLRAEKKMPLRFALT
jgi:hypothetical protein